jgi:ABC-type transport system involved in multi-copper enzyme maturation permease subunit
LSLLVLTASLAIAVFAPAFHYHQFGEPARMARDAGLSALFVGGTIFVVVGAARSVRREFESGTAAVALSHPVSRVQFLLAKACGAYAAFALFALALCAVTAVIVNGSLIGAAVAKKTGDIPRLWGVSYACGVASVVLPYVVGAFLNRVFRFRFALSAFVTTIVIAAASLVYRPEVSLVGLLPAMALLFVPAAFFAMAATSAAAHLKMNAASAVCAVLVAAFLPFAGNYCLSNALSRGGTIPWAYVAVAALAAVPAVLAAAFAGAALRIRA